MKFHALRWYALLEGCFLVAIGVIILGNADLIVGGSPGLALIAHHYLPLTMGSWLLLANLPFFVLAFLRLRREFALISLACSFIVSLLVDLLGPLLAEVHMPQPLAALLAGLLIGFGLVVLFRQRGSIGGVNILALYLELRWGWHSAKVILAWDISIGLLSLLIFDWQTVVSSLIAFAVLASVIGRYHPRQVKQPIQPLPSAMTAKGSL
ncbi:YitT family protein [Corallincola spongiicola]|uniref:YitT family protein n=1 Tax=Corallincola spongiicola TaxID=2520508 RepID=A0ABY1WQN4_9GAMM|nr:YitT family protein [Corallincola spongiicola]TAA47032.1 YitT family protein [Corallincola spongiicola]